MKNLNYLMSHILYQIFKIILNIYILEKHGEKTVNPLIRIYINKIKNQIIFKINRIQDVGVKRNTPHTSFFPVTSTNVGTIPKIFLTLSFNTFATL